MRWWWRVIVIVIPEPVATRWARIIATINHTLPAERLAPGVLEEKLGKRLPLGLKLHLARGRVFSLAVTSTGCGCGLHPWRCTGRRCGGFSR